MYKIVIIVSCCLLLTGYNASAQEVLVVDEDQTVPDGSILLGNIRIWDGGFKFNCGYSTVMQDAKTQALEMGGNVVKVTTLKVPDAWSSCYRLKAEIYLSDQLSSVAIRTAYEDSVKKSLIPEGADHAYLYVYRPYTAAGMDLSYNLYDEDGTTLCRVKPNSINKIKISRPGRITLSARTEVERTVSIDVQPGALYYLRCGVSMGVVAGRPELDLVSNRLGMAELSYMIEDRKKVKDDKSGNMDDIYK